MMINGVNDMNRNLSVNVAGVDTQDISSARLKAMKRSGQVECETCANREYKDGSDEVNVSFKSAAHIAPSAAATKVMAHEQEHVSNANRKAASKDGEVLNATVTLKMAVKYPATSYGQNQKSADYPEFAGKNVDYAG